MSTCTYCLDRFAAKSREQLATRKRNMAARPDITTYACPKCGGTDWATTEARIASEPARTRWIDSDQAVRVVWWANIGIVFLLCLNALFAATSDHGLIMAFNCILIGVYFGALVYGWMMETQREIMTLQDNMLEAQRETIAKQNELMDRVVKSAWPANPKTIINLNPVNRKPH